MMIADYIARYHSNYFFYVLKQDIIRNSYINYHAYCKQPSLFITVQVRITLIPFTDLYEYYVLQRRF